MRIRHFNPFVSGSRGGQIQVVLIQSPSVWLIWVSWLVDLWPESWERETLSSIVCIIFTQGGLFNITWLLWISTFYNRPHPFLSVCVYVACLRISLYTLY